jgi:FlaA1/EpsC-like NDP-sugar epimerase
MERIKTLAVTHRTAVLLLAHVAIFAVAYEAALRLRFDSGVPADVRRVFWISLPWIVACKLLVFHQFGNLHGWWRYVTFADLVSLLKVATLSTLLIAVVGMLLVGQFPIPRSVLILDWAITILFVGGLRSVWRLQHEHLWPSLSRDPQRPALMVGGDKSCEALVRQIHNHPRLNYRIVGFLHQDRTYLGSRLGGIPFLGGPERAVQIARARHITDVLVVAGSIAGASLRTLIADCLEAGLQLKILPSADQLMNSPRGVPVRDVDINDLLHRPPVQLDLQAIGGMLAGRSVLVTGAGGSIGSEICRQVLRHRPEQLVLVDRSENGLFHLDRELSALGHASTVWPCIADICDPERMRALFRRYQPDIVFHAAAHKHVPLMEANPGEAVKNNVLGTMGLADLADEFRVERFVMISTDKAVHPASVMGATKHLAERYVHACSQASVTRFVVVRFGNVLASAGSVVPIFQEQIRRGGPITVTHPDMKRYFMTIPEASQLVLQAAAMGQGGEIFVLDMGEPMRIVDLARDLVRLSGLSADDIEIQFTGIRPGEKVHEELYQNEETVLPTAHPKVRMARHQPTSRAEVLAAILALAAQVQRHEEVIRRKLQEVADYAPHITLSASVPVPVGIQDT